MQVQRHQHNRWWRCLVCLPRR